MKVHRRLGRIAGYAALAVAGALALGACTAPDTAAAGNGPAVPATSSANPAPVSSAPSSTTPPVPAAPVTTAYDAARVQWQGGATASSADEGRFWANAVADLTNGEMTDTDPAGYPAAITRLDELISLPDAQQTPAQNAAYHSDLTALNAFFKTPGLYS